MKRYLMGLGAMLVGAGLMFVLMHGEVRADGKPEPFICSEDGSTNSMAYLIINCRVGKRVCTLMATREGSGFSCVQTGGFFN